jgi:predicted metal-dependent phosphoesterase TrpH
LDAERQDGRSAGCDYPAWTRGILGLTSLIDLHTHTYYSDGTASPEELVSEARAIGLEALAVTDHDTFEGYDATVPIAANTGLPLVRGIELSTKYKSKSVHLLGYFPAKEPAAEFTRWVLHMQESRRDRNRRLIASLQDHGIDITLEEVERKGRSLAGRPHFAKVMIEKGYVPDIETAFREYLDESARAYVEREEAQLSDAIERVRNAGGIPSLAHPVRILRNNYGKVDALVREMLGHGLMALEVYHSDHKPEDVVHYTGLANEIGLKITGGSDFHGANKPRIKLGTGYAGNLAIPYQVLEDLIAST